MLAVGIVDERPGVAGARVRTDVRAREEGDGFGRKCKGAKKRHLGESRAEFVCPALQLL